MSYSKEWQFLDSRSMALPVCYLTQLATYQLHDLSCINVPNLYFCSFMYKMGMVITFFIKWSIFRITCNMIKTGLGIPLSYPKWNLSLWLLLPLLEVRQGWSYSTAQNLLPADFQPHIATWSRKLLLQFQFPLSVDPWLSLGSSDFANRAPLWQRSFPSQPPLPFLFLEKWSLSATYFFL